MDDITWDVLQGYLEDEKFLVKHHVDSYNDFTSVKIKNIIHSLNPFVTLKMNRETNKPKHAIEVFIGGETAENIYFTKPLYKDALLLPNMARLENQTYQCDILCDIFVRFIIYDTNGLPKETKTSSFQKIKIGTIPIMLHSNICCLYKQPREVRKEMGECVFDIGGYFIVDGKEKVIVSQERIATNRLFLNKSKLPEFTYQGMIRNTTEEAAIFPKTVNIAVYSDQYLKGSRKNAIVMSLPNIDIPIPVFILFRALGVESDKRILEHILYDLDDNTSKPMAEFLYYSLRDSSFVYTQDQSIQFLSKHVQYKDEDYVRFVLANDLFPNMNEGSGNDMYINLHKKAMFLGHVVRNIVKICLGMATETDRDNYAFKRVDVSGFLMGNLFRDLYNAFRNECRSSVDRSYNYGPWQKDGDVTQVINNSNRWQIFNSNIIENGMVRSLKGSWGVDKDNAKQGLVQDLSRISYIGFLSHLRRVNTPVDRSVKIVAPHRLHPTQFGVMCPCETPDGANVGLLKNFAMTCHVSSDCSSKEIVRCLLDLGMEMLDKVRPQKVAGDVCKILINSNWVGIVHEPRDVVDKLHLLRRNALINVMTSISWNIVGKEININTEAGRCCRPLYIVEQGKLLIQPEHVQKLKKGALSWTDLIKGNTLNHVDFTDCTYRNPREIFTDPSVNVWQKLIQNQSVIEFIDVEEANTCMIAMEFKDLEKSNTTYTHCEIHPSTMFAVLTANISFANHNQAPRNYFSGAQVKQAIGMYNSAFNNRMDTMSYLMHYPQKPIVNTRYQKYLGLNNMTNGVNAIVAIMCYSGYNQEDSMLINRAAIDRGLFCLTYFKTIVEQEDSDKFGNTKILFNNPAELVKQGNSVEGFGKRFANYTILDENGFPKVGSHIHEGNAYIGKTIVNTEYVDDADNTSIFKTRKRIESFRDKSEVAGKVLSGMVDKVHVFEGKDGLKTCKIRLRKVRRPVLGDKHASRYAQKGTIGMIMEPEDMPRTMDGIVPDLIINPHAIPTRMTIAQLIESVLAKLGALQGEFYDGTPFVEQDIDSAYDVLEQHGYERYGNEILYNGMNGEQIATEIFIGPTYSMRLKHMVEDKINSRNGFEGTYTGLTRQPVKSRSKEGGLRIGEMESAVVVSHGMSSFLQESMMERSDKFSYFIANRSGDIAVVNPQKGIYRTNEDSQDTDFTRVATPFCAKLMLQEMQSMSVMPRLVTDASKLEYEDVALEEYLDTIEEEAEGDDPMWTDE